MVFNDWSAFYVYSRMNINYLFKREYELDCAPDPDSTRTPDGSGARIGSGTGSLTDYPQVVVINLAKSTGFNARATNGAVSGAN
jgi:hypothetical protein